MNKKAGKGWTEERRRKQAEHCRRNKPWEKSTGPKTAAGKARCSMNAYKHGGRAAIRRHMGILLMHNRKFIEALMALEQTKLMKSTEKQSLIISRSKNENTE